MTGEDLNLKPSTVEQAKFEYSLLGKIFNKGLNEEGRKEGILKRLENIEKNQNKHNNDNDKSELSSARSESSKKTSISSDDESQTSPEYLKNSTEEFFWWLSKYFLFRFEKIFQLYCGSGRKIY